MSDSEDVNESETSSEEHESLNIKSNDFEAFRKESKPEPKFSTASSGHDYRRVMLLLRNNISVQIKTVAVDVV